MDAIEHDQNEPELIPFQQICARHGAKINQYHRCPKCVVEEVRRHERRIAASFDREFRFAPDLIDEATPPAAKIR